MLCTQMMLTFPPHNYFKYCPKPSMFLDSKTWEPPQIKLVLHLVASHDHHLRQDIASNIQYCPAANQVKLLNT